MKKILGIGINDATYVTNIRETVGYDCNGRQLQKLIWICPYYDRWKTMLTRCYGKKRNPRNNSYIGCSVCEEWLSFSNFRAWMEQQDWEGKELDKDLLVPGNKVYKAEACVFVSRVVNGFVTESGAKRGEWPIGVSKRSTKFLAGCNNPFSKKREYLGLYETPQEAHKAWLKRKLELAKILADEQDDPRVARALISKYENYSLEEFL